MGAAFNECKADVHMDFIGTSCHAYMDSDPDQTTYDSAGECLSGERGNVEWGDFERARHICSCTFKRAWDAGLDDVEFLQSGENYLDNALISNSWTQCHNDANGPASDMPRL
jgi:hypothetical protein